MRHEDIETIYDELLRAVGDLDLQRVEELLHLGLNPNRPVCLPEIGSLLHFAIDAEIDSYNQSWIDIPRIEPTGKILVALLEAGADCS